VKAYTYYLLDIFTDVPFGGNPMAVFTDASGLSDEQMQCIARELNLSETTFVFPPRDDSHHHWVRIFTPLAELPSGGQPTIGTAFALAYDAQEKLEEAPTRVVFGEAAGPVSVQMQTPMSLMQQPLPEFGPVFEQTDAIAAILGIDASELVPGLPVQSVSCGMPYLLVPLRSLDAIGRIRFRMDIWDRVLRLSRHPHILPFTMKTVYSRSAVHCRMFAPGLGVFEDPATATASGPLAAYLIRYGVIKAEPRMTLIVEQGIEVGRPSFIHVSIERSESGFSSIRVGGQCVAIGQGHINIS
jgi:trans-2,3-dihydro-3-hydroxyanthranilate isomerase